MKIKRTVLNVVAVVVFSLFSATGFASMIFTATLDGSQEVPSVVTTGSGTASGILSGGVGAYVFTYTINYSNLVGPTGIVAGHFHNAGLGLNGPVAHFFDNITGITSGVITGDWRFDDGANPLTDALANQLMAGNIYINLHTGEFPAGEIRGQLSKVPNPPMLFLLLAGTLALCSRRKVT